MGGVRVNSTNFEKRESFRVSHECLKVRKVCTMSDLTDKLVKRKYVKIIKLSDAVAFLVKKHNEIAELGEKSYYCDDEPELCDAILSVLRAGFAQTRLKTLVSASRSAKYASGVK